MQKKRKYKPVPKAINKCDSCGQPVQRHRVCKCGVYRGKQVIKNNPERERSWYWPQGWQTIKRKNGTNVKNRK